MLKDVKATFQREISTEKMIVSFYISLRVSLGIKYVPYVATLMQEGKIHPNTCTDYRG